MTTIIDAITLIQPWGSLIDLLGKRYETRSWQTRYRGLIAIHAGRDTSEIRAINANLLTMRGWDDARKLDYLRTDPRGIYLHHCREVLSPRYPRPNDLPLGAVLCICELVAIHRTEDLRTELDQRERVFGNFGDKRFAWEMNVVQHFEQPIPALGKQGIWRWTVPDDVELTVSV